MVFLAGKIQPKVNVIFLCTLKCLAETECGGHGFMSLRKVGMKVWCNFTVLQSHTLR